MINIETLPFRQCLPCLVVNPNAVFNSKWQLYRLFFSKRPSKLPALCYMQENKRPAHQHCLILLASYRPVSGFAMVMSGICSSIFVTLREKKNVIARRGCDDVRSHVGKVGRW